MKFGTLQTDGRVDSAPAPRDNLASRIAWFVALWLAGILALSVVALVIRLAIHA